MAIPEIIEDYLRFHHLEAEERVHPATYTAQQLSMIEHLPDTVVAKVVFVFIDERLTMCVLPANRNISLHQVKSLTHATTVRLANEREISDRINTLQVGAIPPFGSMFGLPVIVDQALLGIKNIEMPAGLLTESLVMPLESYLREESPRILSLSRRPIHYEHKHENRRMDFF